MLQKGVLSSAKEDKAIARPMLWLHMATIDLKPTMGTSYIHWLSKAFVEKDAIPRCEMPKGSLEGSSCICLLQMKSLLVGKGILMNSGHTSSHEDFKLPTTCAPAGTFYRKYLHFASSFTARRTATLSSANMSLSTHGRFQPRSKQRKTGREVDDTADKAYLGIRLAKTEATRPPFFVPDHLAPRCHSCKAGSVSYCR